MKKIIKSDKDYEIAINKIEKLIDLDPDPGTSDADELELYALLIEDYESRMFKENELDPVEAILFRMEQGNLKPRDLIPYIGSRSKVSEVLSGKRKLTLNMVKGLNKGLGIPLNSLLGNSNDTNVDREELNWTRFPIKEMIKRKWVEFKVTQNRDELIENIQTFYSYLGNLEEVYALYRKTENIRSGRQLDRYSLTSWTARIIWLYTRNPAPDKYKVGLITKEFMNEITKLSIKDNSPVLVQEYLKDHGVTLVIEPHLPKTRLDGIAIMYEQNPIIGLTLRYDRLDNFWFTLMHELAHLSLHLDNNDISFYDDLDLRNPTDKFEKDADKLASETLIPNKEWHNSPASKLPTSDAAIDLANKLSIHPAIVAGRMRFEFNTYYILKNLIGFGEVRKYFSERKWS